MNRRWLLILLLLATPAMIYASMFVLCVRDVAWEYDDLTFIAFGGDEFNYMNLERKAGTPNYFIKYRELPLFATDDVRIDDFRELRGASFYTDPDGFEVCSDGYAYFYFRNGKLHSASIRTRSSSMQVEIGRSKEGPFLTIPATRAQVKAVFGRPRETSSSPTSLR